MAVTTNSDTTNNKLATLITGFLAVFLLSFGGGWLGSLVYNNNVHETSTAAKQQYIANESEVINEIAESTGKGIVSIDVQRQVSVPDIFGFGSSSTRQQSAGTGFIIDNSGTIVTNRHVVPQGTETVNVTLSDGTVFEDVKVIGRTSSNSPLDVAFLKIADLKGKKLDPVTLGDSSEVKIGDKAIAIGNALGQFQNTVTSGIISGFGRDVIAGDSGNSSENLTDLFQTDAAINQGNSGGPLVNINNEVIGINTAIAPGAQNIGFAIPINDVKGLIKSVLSTGELKQPYLGVRYVSLTPQLAAELDLDENQGAYITASGGQASVIPGSPADKAGLKNHDIITKVNDIELDEDTSLASALSQFQVGESVELTVIRDGKTMTMQATLAETPKS